MAQKPDKIEVCCNARMPKTNWLGMSAFGTTGRERQFGSFPTKTKAREFYEKAKLEQKEGRFFPERY